jgi:hypothetical protein
MVEAGLVPARIALQNRIDPRWSEAALAIMREHTHESKPSEKAVKHSTTRSFSAYSTILEVTTLGRGREP